MTDPEPRMTAALTLPGLHLDTGDGPLGITVHDVKDDDRLVASVPLEDRASYVNPFNIFGTPETLLAFAEELAAAVRNHVAPTQPGDSPTEDQDGPAEPGAALAGQ